MAVPDVRIRLDPAEPGKASMEINSKFVTADGHAPRCRPGKRSHSTMAKRTGDTRIVMKSKKNTRLESDTPAGR